MADEKPTVACTKCTERMDAYSIFNTLKKQTMEIRMRCPTVRPDSEEQLPEASRASELKLVTTGVGNLDGKLADP